MNRLKVTRCRKLGKRAYNILDTAFYIKILRITNNNRYSLQEARRKSITLKCPKLVSFSHSDDAVPGRVIEKIGWGGGWDLMVTNWGKPHREKKRKRKKSAVDSIIRGCEKKEICFKCRRMYILDDSLSRRNVTECSLFPKRLSLRNAERFTVSFSAIKFNEKQRLQRVEE